MFSNKPYKKGTTFYQCDVDFDLDEEDDEPDSRRNILVVDRCNQIEDPENDLADVISDSVGWCVNTISYKDYNDAECPPADFNPDLILNIECEAYLLEKDKNSD